MTTANESDLQGKCADLVRALDAERQHSATLTARIGRLTATIERMDAEGDAAEALIIQLRAEVERLTAENAALIRNSEGL